MKVTDEMAEAAAKAVHEYIWTVPWEDMPIQYQADLMRQERAALEAALAVAPVKNVDTSPERDKKGDDSLHVERVEAAYQAWISFPHKRGVNNAVDAIRAALEAADAVVTERDLELLAHEHAREEYGVGPRAVDQRVAFEQGALFALTLFRGGAK